PIFESLVEAYNQWDKLEKAIDYIKQIIQSHPDSAAAHYALAYAYIHYKDYPYENSLQDLDWALDLNPAFLEAQRLKAGWSAYGIPLPKQRMEDLQRALAWAEQLNDRHLQADMLMKIGNLYTFQGQEQKALEPLSRSLEIFKAIGSGWGEVGSYIEFVHVYSKRGDVGQALHYLERAWERSQALNDEELQVATLTALVNFV